MTKEHLEALAKSCHEKLQADPRNENLAKQLLFLFAEMEDYAKLHKLVSLYRGDSVFQQSLEWHRSLSRVYMFCLDRSANEKGMTDHLLAALYSFDSYLTILYRSRSESSLDEAVPVLRLFDQLLWKLCRISCLTPPAGVMRDHFLGQLAYHIAVVLLRKASQEHLPIDEAVGLSSLALLFAQKLGCSIPREVVIPNKEEEAVLDKLKHDAKYRVIQSNLTLRNWSSSTSNDELVIRGFMYSNKVREKIFHTIFPEPVALKYSSCWLNSDVFTKLPTTLSSVSEILSERDLCSFMCSCRFSIHDLVWLGVQLLLLNVSGKSNPIFPPIFNCWDVAQLGNISFQNLVTGRLETLSSVDIDTFLYLTIFSCYFAVKDKKPSILLSAAMPVLPTDAQCQFWTALWKLRGNKLTIDSTATLIKGIETVRLMGQHGVDVELTISVARTFMDHAEKVLQPCFEAEISSMKNRALLFWNHSIEKLKSSCEDLKECSAPANLLFPYRSKFSEKRPAEVSNYIVEGHALVASEDDMPADLDSRTCKIESCACHEDENLGNEEQSDYELRSMDTAQEIESNCSHSSDTSLYTSIHSLSQGSVQRRKPTCCAQCTSLDELAVSQLQLVKIMEKLADKMENLEEMVGSDFQLVKIVDKLADKVKSIESGMPVSNTVNLHPCPKDSEQTRMPLAKDLHPRELQLRSVPNQGFLELSTDNSCDQQPWQMISCAVDSSPPVDAGFPDISLEPQENDPKLQKIYIQSRLLDGTDPKFESNPSDSECALTDACTFFSSVSHTVPNQLSKPVLSANSHTIVQSRDSLSDVNANYKILKPPFPFATAPSLYGDETFFAENEKPVNKNESVSSVSHFGLKFGSQESPTAEESKFISLKNALFNIKSVSCKADSPPPELVSTALASESAERLHASESPQNRSLSIADTKTLFSNFISFIKQKKSDNLNSEGSKPSLTNNETASAINAMSSLKRPVASLVNSDLQQIRSIYADHSLPPIDETGEEAIPISLFEEFVADFLGHFQ